MNADDLSNPLEYIAKQQYKNWIEFYTKNTFKSFENNFKDESEFNKFLNNFNDENEKFKFIFCGNYYHYLKFNAGLNANIQLIMILSIVEKIYSKDDFIDFKDWCAKNQSEINIRDFTSFKGMLECLKSQYHKIHGSRQKVSGFFQDYFDEEDKKSLLDSIIFKPTIEDLDGEKIDFHKFINILYIMRNNFVHDARFVPIHKEGGIGGNIRYNNKEVFVHFEMKMDEFLKMFEKAYINYFRSLQNDTNQQTG